MVESRKKIQEPDYEIRYNMYCNTLNDIYKSAVLNGIESEEDRIKQQNEIEYISTKLKNIKILLEVLISLHPDIYDHYTNIPNLIDKILLKIEEKTLGKDFLN